MFHDFPNDIQQQITNQHVLGDQLVFEPRQCRIDFIDYGLTQHDPIRRDFWPSKEIGVKIVQHLGFAVGRPWFLEVECAQEKPGVLV